MRESQVQMFGERGDQDTKLKSPICLSCWLPKARHKVLVTSDARLALDVGCHHKGQWIQACPPMLTVTDE